jgi:ribulose-phosphate 3-epimerase
MLPVQIGPSLLACDLANMASEAKKILGSGLEGEEKGADYLHLDVMDGHFVPNISFGAPVIACLRKNIPNPVIFDVHLMVTSPEQWIDDMAEAGVSTFLFHVETDGDKGEMIRRVKQKGMKVGLVVKPKTPVEDVLPFLDEIDQVLIMTVEPGFGGQKFMKEMMPKVRETLVLSFILSLILSLILSHFVCCYFGLIFPSFLSFASFLFRMLSFLFSRSFSIVLSFSQVRYLRDLRPTLNIEVDGGLGLETIKEAYEAGANMIVAGSAVFKASNPKAMIEQLRG